MHVIKCFAYFAGHTDARKLTLIELTDGTAMTMGTPRPPISSRRIASYFRYVIRRTNQRPMALFRDRVRSDFRG